MAKYSVDSQGNLIPIPDVEQIPQTQPSTPAYEEAELEEEPEAEPEKEEDDWDDIFGVETDDIMGEDSALPDPTDIDFSDIFSLDRSDIMGTAPKRKKKAYKITRKGRGYQPPPGTSLGGIR